MCLKEDDSDHVLQKVTWYKVSQIQELFEMMQGISGIKDVVQNEE